MAAPHVKGKNQQKRARHQLRNPHPSDDSAAIGDDSIHDGADARFGHANQSIAPARLIGLGQIMKVLRTAAVAAVVETLGREYRKRIGRALTSFVSRPARGAHMVDPLTVVGR